MLNRAVKINILTNIHAKKKRLYVFIFDISSTTKYTKIHEKVFLEDGASKINEPLQFDRPLLVTKKH